MKRLGLAKDLLAHLILGLLPHYLLALLILLGSIAILSHSSLSWRHSDGWTLHTVGLLHSLINFSILEAIETLFINCLAWRLLFMEHFWMMLLLLELGISNSHRVVILTTCSLVQFAPQRVSWILLSSIYLLIELTRGSVDLILFNACIIMMVDLCFYPYRRINGCLFSQWWGHTQINNLLLHLGYPCVFHLLVLLMKHLAHILLLWVVWRNGTVLVPSIQGVWGVVYCLYFILV